MKHVDEDDEVAELAYMPSIIDTPKFVKNSEIPEPVRSVVPEDDLARMNEVFGDIDQLDSSLEDVKPIECGHSQYALSDEYIETLLTLKRESVGDINTTGSIVVDSSVKSYVTNPTISTDSFVYLQLCEVNRSVSNPRSDVRDSYNYWQSAQAIEQYQRANRDSKDNPLIQKGSLFASMADAERFLRDKYDDPDSPLSHVDSYALRRDKSWDYYTRAILIYHEPKLNIYNSHGAIDQEALNAAIDKPMPVHHGYTEGSYIPKNLFRNIALPKGFVIRNGILSYSLKKWARREASIGKRLIRKYTNGLNKTDIAILCNNLLDSLLIETRLPSKDGNPQHPTKSCIYFLRLTRNRACELDDIEAILKLVKKAGTLKHLHDLNNHQANNYKALMLKLGRCIKMGDQTKIPNFLKNHYRTESKRLKITKQEIFEQI